MASTRNSQGVGSSILLRFRFPSPSQSTVMYVCPGFFLPPRQLRYYYDAYLYEERANTGFRGL